MRPIIVIFYLVWGYDLSVQAQSGLIRFDSLSIDQGFPAATVLSFLRDTRGFMWFGTRDGLVRYDGVNYRVYYPDKSDSTQLYQNHIFHLYEDLKGRIWLTAGAGTTTSKTIQVFDPRTEEFTRLPFTPVLNSWLYNQLNAQHYFLEDEEGSLWIKCYSTGLYKVEETSPDQFSVTNYKVSSDYPEAASADSVSVLFLDSRKKFWVGTRQGLYQFDRSKEKFVQFLSGPDEKPDHVTGIVEDQTGSLWINYERQGLGQYNQVTNDFAVKWPEPNPAPSWFNSRYLILDNSDNLWMLRQGGKTYLHSSLDRFNIRTGEVTRYFTAGSDRVTLWYSFHQMDREGNIWVSFTREGGIYRYNPSTTRFEVVSKFPPGGLHNLYFDRNDNIWATDWHKGVWQFHYSNQKIEILSNEPSTVCLEDRQGNIISAQRDGIVRYTLNTNRKVVKKEYIFKEKACGNLVRDQRGRLWASCYDQETIELISIDPGSNKVNRLALPSYLESVRSVAEIPDQGIMVGSRSNGLFYYDFQTEEITRFSHDPDDPTSISSNILNRTIVDDQNKVWIYNQLGFHRYEVDQRNFVRIDPGSIWENSNNLNEIAAATNGQFWIGGPKGLTLYEPETGQILRNYLVKDGFPTKEIHTIISDDNGDLWLGTRFGLVHLNVASEQFKTYDMADGLPANYVTTGYKRANGEMVFGTSQGLVIFHSDKLPLNQHRPQPVFTEFRLFNQPVGIGEEILSQSISFTEEITLQHHQNVISFTYTALSLVSPDKNQYAYFMKGIDQDWNYVGNQTYASYAGLPPGKYVLNLKAANNDGVWSTPTSLTVIIRPPWWKTGWAYGLYIMLALTAVLALRRYEMKRLKLRQQAEYLSELDRLKTRFFANISHEFRTPLTLILAPLEKLLTQSAYEKEYPLFRTMQRNAQRLLNLVNQLLDLSKLEAGSMRLEIKPTALLPFLNGVVFSFSSLAERKKIGYHFQYPTSNPVVYVDADKLEKIVTNILSNAFKFTPEGGVITVTAQLLQNRGIMIPPTVSEAAPTASPDLLELTVQDSGVGMSDDQLSQVFSRFYQAGSFSIREQDGSGIGLSLVYELVELHGGKVSIVSNPGQGSCFKVCLPLRIANLEEVVISDPVFPDQSHNLLPKRTNENGSLASSEAPLVLLVEDNEDVRSFLRDSLQSLYQVLEAPDGQAGLEKAWQTIPDLVISDVMMPRMDGIQLCEKLKQDEKTAHVPVILLTAKASSGDKIEGLQCGADDYIIKPFQTKEVRVRVRNLIESRKKLREHFSREIRLSSRSVSLSTADEQFMQRVMQVIEEHMADTAFGVEDFSRRMGMSRTQLFRKLKALTDHSPSDFVRIIRLKRGADLLTQRTGNIAEVAYQVGFNEPSYFTKCFHKQFGQTPSEYVANTVS